VSFLLNSSFSDNSGSSIEDFPTGKLLKRKADFAIKMTVYHLKKSSKVDDDHIKMFGLEAI
jgi:hypothetical protein